MPTPARTTQRRQFDHGLALIALFAITLIAVEISDMVGGPYDGAVGRVILLFPAAGAVYIATGLIAWRRRPFNQVGPLLVLGGLSLLLGGLTNVYGHVPVALGKVFAVLCVPVVVHLIFAFPSGRLTGRASRWIVGATYVVRLVVHAPVFLFSPIEDPRENVLRITPNQTIYDVASRIEQWGSIALALLTCVVLVRRVVLTPAGTRWALGLLYVVGSLSIALLIFAKNISTHAGIDPVTLVAVQLCCVAVIPVAFLAGLLRGGFSKAGGMEELARGAFLRASTDELEPALVSALGDPSARIHLAPERPEPARNRGSVEVLAGGVAVATIAYDTRIYPSSEAVGSVASLFGLIIQRDRLAADLAGREEEVMRSRDRIVQAGDLERRRLATDLHDRLQSKLVLLAMRVQAEQPALAAPGPSGAARPITDDVAEVIDELRRVIDDVMPPLLMERGLPAALEELTDRMPVPTALAVSTGDVRLPRATESTLYFVAAESLTNAVKHADPSALAVTVAVLGDRVTLDIDDDGPGGAVPGPGLGLRSSADRIAAIGGAMAIERSPTGGTRIHAEVPCES